MKPGDHPDFYRFPAPEGRSRESTIVLDAMGRWHHEGEPVEHAGLAAAFSSWVTVHPEDGRWILSNGYDWCYFTPLTTAYFVVGLRQVDGVRVALSDGTEEPLDPNTLRQDADGALRCVVKGGRYGARFTRLAQLAMEPRLVDAEPIRVEVQGRRYPVLPFEAAEKSPADGSAEPVALRGSTEFPRGPGNDRR